ncbi:MAG: deoxyribonuclease IV, partial [bacterium]|nr:deoxyribonuclease IV [bacterium]
MVKIGAHQSISGNYGNALSSVSKIGGNCLQIFSTSPRGWNFAKITDQNINDFIELKAQLKIEPVFFHASYLINLADNGRIGQLSKQSLKHELNIASKLGIIGSIIHLGSYKKLLLDDRLSVLCNNIKEILDNTPNNVFFIIENAGNKKIGQSIDEITKIINEVGNKKLAVCLDTCHLYSAGYDLSSEEKLTIFLDEFDSKIGLEKLKVFHLNDSKDPFNSGRDKHENIGAGTIPLKEFELLLNHPKLQSMPFIIETPGFDQKGPDKKNIDILKGLL